MTGPTFRSWLRVPLWDGGPSAFEMQRTYNALRSQEIEIVLHRQTKGTLLRAAARVIVDMASRQAGLVVLLKVVSLDGWFSASVARDVEGLEPDVVVEMEVSDEMTQRWLEAADYDILAALLFEDLRLALLRREGPSVIWWNP